MTTEQILEATSIALQMDVADIKSASRKTEHIQARMIVAKLMRDKRATWQLIGDTLGGRDHSSIMHNYKTFESDYEANYKGIKDKFNKVKDKLYGNQSIVTMATVCGANVTAVQ